MNAAIPDKIRDITLARDEPALAKAGGKPIVRRPPPALPTLIRPLPDKPLQAESLDDLARHIHRLRGERGLRVGLLEFACHGGCDTFPGFYLYALDPDTGAEHWLGFAAVQAQRPDALQAALRRTEPKAADRPEAA